MPASGGWVEGDAKFMGENPPGGALIHYVQKTRHLFGPLKLEVLDGQGNVVDTLPAGKRRGINRVSWAMRAKPPRVPKAATISYGAFTGPRLPPGTYKVRLTKGDKVLETPLEVGLDRRATYSAAERVEQYQTSLEVCKLFEDMTSLVERIQGARAKASSEKDPLYAKFVQDAEEVRKLIVATKEGGAITGEERLREHTDQLYSSLMSYEGRPTAYQKERIGVLRRELQDVEARWDELLKMTNAELQKKGLPQLDGQATVANSDVERAFQTFFEAPLEKPAFVRRMKRRY